MEPDQIAVQFSKHSHRADLLMEVDRWREALHELNQQLRSHPDNYSALCKSALCHYRLKEYQRAYDITKTAITNSPEEEWAYRLQSLVFSANGEYGRALDAAQICVEKAPYLFASLQTLFYAQAEYGLLDEAGLTLELLLKTGPDDEDAHVASGFLSLKTKNLDKAEHHFLEALKIDANCVNALNNLGVVFMEKAGKTTAKRSKYYRRKSVEMFERAVKAQPTYLTAQKNIKLASMSPAKKVGIVGGLAAVGLYAGIPILQNLLYTAAQNDFSNFWGILGAFSPFSQSYPVLLANFLAIMHVVLISASLAGAYFSYDYRERVLEKLQDPMGWFVLLINLLFPLLLYLYAFWNGAAITAFSEIVIRVFSLALFLSILRFVMLIQIHRSQE